MLDDLGVELVALQRTGDLDPGEHRLGDRARQRQSAQQLGHRATRLAARRQLGQLAARRRHRVRVHPVDAARLADVVAHARPGELEPGLRGVGLQHVVALEHELGAALDRRQRAARRRERFGPHAAADAVARLEHHDVVNAGAHELGRRRQAGEAGAHDPHAHPRILSYGAASPAGGRNAAMRVRRGREASRSAIFTTAANGTARIAPSTPRIEPAIRTETIVVNGESSTARR